MDIRRKFGYMCPGCGERHKGRDICCKGVGGSLPRWFSPADDPSQVTVVARWLIDQGREVELARDITVLSDEQVAELDEDTLVAVLAHGPREARLRAMTALSLREGDARGPEEPQRGRRR